MNATDYANNTNASVEEATNLWVSCQVTVSICTIVDFYVFICLLIFHQRESKRVFGRSRKKREHLDLERSVSEASMKRLSRKRSSHYEGSEKRTEVGRNRKIRIWMLRVATMASFVALLKFLTDQLKFFTAWKARSDSICEIINDVTEIGMYGTALNCIYGFLWMRQWLFYNNPAVKGLLYRKRLIQFSKCLGVVIISIATFAVVFHILPQRYGADKAEIYTGCVAVYDMTNINDAWSIVLYIVMSLTFQLSLFGLFVYPFIRRKLDARAITKNMKKTRSERKKSTLSQANESLSEGKRSSTVESKKNSCENASNNNEQLTATSSLVGNAHQSMPTNKQSLRVPTNRDDDHSNAKDDSQIEHSRKRSVKVHLKKSLFSFCPSFSKDESSSVEHKLTPKKSAQSQVYASVRRVVFWCMMCILSDITTVLVALVNGPGTSLILITALNNVNITVNILCLIATYSRWRNILWPLRKSKLRDGDTFKSQHNEDSSFRRFSESSRSMRQVHRTRTMTLDKSSSLYRKTLERSPTMTRQSTKRSPSPSQRRITLNSPSLNRKKDSLINEL